MSKDIDVEPILDALAALVEDHLMSRNTERRTVGLGSILRVSHAAALLPISDRRAREWLRDQQLVLDLDGKPIVVWRAVVERLTEQVERGELPPLRSGRTHGSKNDTRIAGVSIEEVDAWLADNPPSK